MMYTLQSAPGDVRRSVYSVERLKRLVHGADTGLLRVMGRESEPEAAIKLDLRGDHPHIVSRQATLLREASDLPALAVRAFLEMAVQGFSVRHGGAARSASRWHASAEAGLVLQSEIGDEMERRISFDSAHEREATQLARRLYPVTIFGAELWAKLPPFPEVEPRPKVEDLGACKLVTCWPELVDAHDLQFLLGTRALRRWLWPYTIQNPADDPDELDRKLKWAELLPWG